jgi:peptidoglycan hydrolase-like protein with peptidoglycan-binding domain
MLLTEPLAFFKEKGSSTVLNSVITMGDFTTMKIFELTASTLLLLLPAAILAPGATLAASSPTAAARSADLPSAQLISQTPGVLRLGDTGTAVGDLQNNLAILGYFSGNTTSFFGPVTEDAVRRFQSDRGQVVDGIVGPSTLEAILQQVGPPSLVPRAALRLNDSGEQVLELQRRLSDLGWFTGPETGFFGPQTEAAVINFQVARGLTADGIVGATTADALRQ